MIELACHERDQAHTVRPGSTAGFIQSFSTTTPSHLPKSPYLKPSMNSVRTPSGQRIDGYAALILNDPREQTCGVQMVTNLCLLQVV